jgi:dTDP-glucose 4,6-dehydratase
MKSTILITGATGFIGRNLTKRLVAEGHTVYALSRHMSSRDLRVLSQIIEKIRFIEGDLTDYHSLQSAVEDCNPEAIIHLGALTPVRLSFDNPFACLRVNFSGTVNLVHAITEYAPKAHLIMASTAEVYGWQPDEKPVREETPLHPSSPYGVSKSAADEYVQMANKVYGLQSTILRCNNTYGRTDESGFFVEYVITKMLESKPVYVGAPEHVRDYMFVDDHVNAYSLALNSDKSIGQIFNVSPGNPISNMELAKEIARLMDFEGEIVPNSYPPGYPRRPAKLDTKYIVLDSSRIRQVLNWVPSVTLEEGLKRTIDMWETRTGENS